MRSTPDYTFGQYKRLFGNPAWIDRAREILVVLALGSALAIVFGFVLAAMVEREKRGEGFFRTVFLYLLAISLIVTGSRLAVDVQPLARHRGPSCASTGFPDAHFNWLAGPETAMYAIILASIWHGLGFYMALMLAGLKSINTEIGAPPASTG